MTYSPLTRIIPVDSEVFMVVRQQIAAILVTELAAQRALIESEATPPFAPVDARVFEERSIQWDAKGSDENALRPRINVWFETKTRDSQASANSVNAQYDMRFNIDAIGFAQQIDDEGMQPDERAAKAAQRVASFVEQVFSSPNSAKLGLPLGVVADREVRTVRTFQPQQDNIGSTQAFACRVQLEVRAAQTAVQNMLQVIDSALIQISRAEDGEILIEALYDL